MFITNQPFIIVKNGHKQPIHHRERQPSPTCHPPTKRRRLGYQQVRVEGFGSLWAQVAGAWDQLTTTWWTFGLGRFEERVKKRGVSREGKWSWREKEGLCVSERESKERKEVGRMKQWQWLSLEKETEGGWLGREEEEKRKGEGFEGHVYSPYSGLFYFILFFSVEGGIPYFTLHFLGEIPLMPQKENKILHYKVARCYTFGG